VASELPADAQQWLGAAESVEGSWWPAWMAWLDEHAGASRAAPRRAGSTKYPVIEPAPGRYVKAKA
jgi:polyhydroxyalkanoate synthase